MKKILTFFATFICLSAWANMANPTEEGDLVAVPFVSQYVDIVKENMRITPDAEFQTAQFNIEYHIKVNKTGVNIPLLFYASEFRENFKVSLDGKEISLTQAPENYKEKEGKSFSDFDYLFGKDKEDELIISESSYSRFSVTLKDLKFFETEMTEGEHIIKVDYVADKWKYKGEWVNEYSFRYVLEPAKHWKSFGALDIIIDGSKCKHTFTTNLGKISSGSLDKEATWHFDSIPTDVMMLDYKPEIPFLAKIMIDISPENLSIILFVLLALYQLFAMKKYRETEVEKVFSWTMLKYSIAVPLVSVLAYLGFFWSIKALIGAESGRAGAYAILALIVFYPILTLVYLPIMWIIDALMRWRMKNK